MGLFGKKKEEKSAQGKSGQKSRQKTEKEVDTRTGKEIREPVKHPAQIAFEKNLKFLNQKTYP